MASHCIMFSAAILLIQLVSLDQLQNVLQQMMISKTNFKSQVQERSLNSIYSKTSRFVLPNNFASRGKVTIAVFFFIKLFFNK